MIKRHKSLAAVAIIVIVALISFGLTTYFRSASRRSEAPKVDPKEHLQEVIAGSIGSSGLNKTGPLPSTPAKKTPPQYADRMSAIVTAALTTGVTVTPSEKAWLVKAGASGPIANSVTVGAQRMDGVTTNWSWQGLTLRIGWTIQPNTVRNIDNWARQNPYATAATMELLSAAACGSLLPALGAIVCSVLWSVFGVYLLNVFHGAHLHNVCVTVKTYLPVLGVFDPYHPKWDTYPYEDGGGWCHTEIYITPPPAPNRQDPRTPGDCKSDPTRRECRV